MRLSIHAMKNKLLVLVPLLVLFGVSTYYVLTTSSLVRFWADDFCSAILLRNHGYWDSQVIWWKGRTGRYSYIAFLDLFELWGLTGARVLPILQYVLILVSAFPFSLLSLFFLINSPNIIQSFYWMTGSLNYFAPFVFLNLFLALLFKKPNKYSLLFGFIFLFIATGFSEAFGVSSLLLLSLLYLIFNNKDKRKIIFVGLISTVMSLVIMSLSPGNSVRSATVSHPENFYELIKSTLMYSRWYLVHLFYIKTFVISMFTIVVGTFVFLKKETKYFKNPRLVLLCSVVFAISVTLAVVGLTYQAMNWEPPERVMAIVNNMIILAMVFFSVALFQIFNRNVSKVVARILFAILVIMLTHFVNSDWSKVKEELKVSAESDTYIAVGKLDGLEDNKGWVKSCIIEYYK